MGKSTIILRSLDKDFVDQVRDATGESTGSKAFQAAAKRLLQQLSYVEELEAETRRLRMLLNAKRTIFRRLVPLCTLVVQISGEDDQFD